MATKSPTGSIRSREVIGVEQFTQRREVFDKFDTVFLPSSPAPSSPVPYRQVEPIFTPNHGKTTANFKRNSHGYSSMRESRTEDRNIEFRSRKYSDNFTSELNQSDDVEYRQSMTERTRRLSKLRRDFLNSNLHEPSSESPFTRNRLRASMPATTMPITNFKLESPIIHKFTFAEYSTPTSGRKAFAALESTEIDGEKENKDPEVKPRHLSLPCDKENSPKDHQKLFEELVKRYSPQRKPVNWNLPPTRPRVVGSVPKSSSSVSDVFDKAYKKKSADGLNKAEDDDVFLKEGDNLQLSKISADKVNISSESGKDHNTNLSVTVTTTNSTIVHTEPTLVNDEIRNSKSSIAAEIDEKNDEVTELTAISKPRKESFKKPNLDKFTDLNIPALIEKMTEEADDMEKKKKTIKVKRKRSFMDKLLFRKKDN